jgi:uncharacterized protein (DUF1499 family)
MKYQYEQSASISRIKALSNKLEQHSACTTYMDLQRQSRSSTLSTNNNLCEWPKELGTLAATNPENDEQAAMAKLKAILLPGLENQNKQIIEKNEKFLKYIHQAMFTEFVQDLRLCLSEDTQSFLQVGSFINLITNEYSLNKLVWTGNIFFKKLDKSFTFLGNSEQPLFIMTAEVYFDGGDNRVVINIAVNQESSDKLFAEHLLKQFKLMRSCNNNLKNLKKEVFDSAIKMADDAIAKGDIQGARKAKQIALDVYEKIDAIGQHNQDNIINYSSKDKIEKDLLKGPMDNITKSFNSQLSELQKNLESLDGRIKNKFSGVNKIVCRVKSFFNNLFNKTDKKSITLKHKELKSKQVFLQQQLIDGYEYTSNQSLVDNFMQKTYAARSSFSNPSKKESKENFTKVFHPANSKSTTAFKELEEENNRVNLKTKKR